MVEGSNHFIKTHVNFYFMSLHTKLIKCLHRLILYFFNHKIDNP